MTYNNDDDCDLKFQYSIGIGGIAGHFIQTTYMLLKLAF